MRIALIADIHGNLVALETALTDIERQDVDRIVCLGDVAVLGPQPHEVVERLQTPAIPMVMGNTDEWALHPKSWAVDDDDERRRMMEVELWGAGRLTNADRAFISSFQPTLSIELGRAETLLCYHGSPRSYNDPILPETPETDLPEMLGKHAATVLAGGHTHAPMIRRYRESLLINPGSVGLPFQKRLDGSLRNPTWAEYALVEAKDGALSVRLNRVTYSLDLLVESVRASGMPHADWWLRDWEQASA